MSLKAKSKSGTKAAATAKRTEKPTEKAEAAGSQEQELRSILEELRQRTLRDIAEKVKSGTAATGQEIGDIYDLASEERTRELDLLMGDRERQKLQQIDNAFVRLEEGTYGFCEECGEPINPKRLRAVPFARSCVDCQQDKENEERMMRDRDHSDKVYAVMHGGEAPQAAFDDDD